MQFQRFMRRLPTAESLRDKPFLKPFAPYLHHHFLWQFNRRSVAGGVATGLFFGILVPFAQIFLAAIAAIFLRVNLPVAALCTLVSNPLTFPPIYYLAYRLGDVLTGSEPIPSETAIDAEVEHAMAVQQGEVDGWIPQLAEWLHSVGFPLMTGLAVLAASAAIVGYVGVSALWHLHVRLSWMRRRQRGVRQP
ncbi:DUF2062 domain-containing protein [Noviherbaspirillum sp.]|uniref:DUF2062 domain-containing protein n=1 Tax=Noviherbaspirillum sp. TaxID=1926288 RepID=UPI002D36A67A|nr:DUF2062 domain-containing protein [Noviherbaspirillum sp.]HZW22699.1 DUF2062 domain-containing protein [Noviherbaspirillum sp.]